MSTSQTPLFSRLKSFSRELYNLDKKFRKETSFSFPWEDFQNELQKKFGKEFVLTPAQWEWQKTTKALDGISHKNQPLAITIPKIAGQVLILLQTSDVSYIMEKMLGVDTTTLEQQDSEFFDQFASFFSVQLFSCLNSLPTIAALSPSLSTPQEQTNETLVQDINILFEGKNLFIRVLVSDQFLESWKKNTPSQVAQQDTQEIQENISLPLCIEAGRTFLSPKQLSTLSAGDVLLIDHPFFTPNSDRARIYLTYNGKPLFRAKSKNGSLQILEMPLTHEAFTPLGGFSMTTPSPSQEDLEQENLEQEDLETEIEKKESDEAIENQEIPEHSDDETTEEPTEHLDDETSVDHEDETTSFEEEPTIALKEEEEAPHLTEEELEENPFEDEEEKDVPEKNIKTAQKIHLSKDPIRVEDIPLTVVVQLAELQMSLSQLSALKPGNLLDLHIAAEDTVALVVNNKVFAEGELVVIGNSVGVHIKEIGFETS